MADIHARPRALPVWSVLRRTLEVWVDNAPAFCGVALLLQAPGIMATLALGLPDPQESRGALLLRLLAFALSWMLSWLAAGVVAHGTLAALAGRPAPVDELLRSAARQGEGILWVSIGVTLLVLLGALLLVLPGLAAYAALWLAVPVRVAEPGLGTAEALRRSRALTAGHRWQIAAILLLLLLALAPLGGVARGLVGLFLGALELRAQIAVLQVASVLAGTVWAVAPAVAYHELRRAELAAPGASEAS